MPNAGKSACCYEVLLLNCDNVWKMKVETMLSSFSKIVSSRLLLQIFHCGLLEITNDLFVELGDAGVVNVTMWINPNVGLDGVPAVIQ